jgi:RNA-binding protein
VTFPLNGKQRSFLRALGHARKPIIQIGHAGLTEPVQKAINQALETHELIKIKVAGEAGESADALVEAIERGARAAVAQVVGHTLLVYRARKKDPAILLPGMPVLSAKPSKGHKAGKPLASKKRPSTRSTRSRADASPRTEENRRSEAHRRSDGGRDARASRRAEQSAATESKRYPEFSRPAPSKRRAEPGRPPADAQRRPADAQRRPADAQRRPEPSRAAGPSRREPSRRPDPNRRTAFVKRPKATG